MTIEKYSVPWEVTKGKRELIFKNNGLYLRGDLDIDLFRGFHAVIYAIRDREGKLYSVLRRFRFYSQELEEFCDITGKLPLIREWYNILQKGYIFPKSMFKPYKEEYRMSFTIVLHRDPTVTGQDIQIVSNLFGQTSLYPDVYVVASKGRDFLYIKQEIYDKLPNKWAINDLAEIVADKLEEQHRIYEQFWIEIAECRATGKIVKIPIYEDYTKKAMFVETPTRYGINIPTVLPKSTTYIVQSQPVIDPTQIDEQYSL